MATTQTKMPTIVIPSGYESDYRKAQSRQKLAEALQAQALGNQGPMTSWAQPLAQIGNAFIAKRLMNKADNQLQDIDDRVREDYTTQSAEFDADARLLKPQDMIAKWGQNPLMADRLKPFTEAYGKALSEREKVYNVGGQLVRGGDVGPTGILPNDPNAPVIRDANNNWVTNAVRATAAQAAQGLQMDDPVHSMTDPRANMAPGGVPVPPVAASRQPDGVTTNGQPAWLVNGQWYDNPEGQ